MIREMMRCKTFEELKEWMKKANFFQEVAFFLIMLFVLAPIPIFIQMMRWKAVDADLISTLLDSIFLISLALIILYIMVYRDTFRLQDLWSKRHPVFFFGIFLVLAFLSTAVNGFDSTAVFGESYRREGFLTYCGYVILFICALFIQSEKRKRQLIACMVHLSALFALVLIPMFFIQPGYPMFKSPPPMFFHQFNHYGYYLAFTGGAAVGLACFESRFKLRIMYLAETALITYALAINSTFGAFLALMVAVVFLGFVAFKRNMLKYALVCAGVWLGANVIAVFTTQKGLYIFDLKTLSTDITNILDHSDQAQSAGTGRWTLWTKTVECIGNKPLLGYGAEGIADALRSSSVSTDRTHNEYLQYAAFFGIPAAVSYVCALADIYLNRLFHLREMSPAALAALVAALAYLVSAFVGNSMYYTAPYLFIGLALAYAPSKGESRNSN